MEKIKEYFKKLNKKVIYIGLGIFVVVAGAPAVFKFEYPKVIVNIVAAAILVIAGYWEYKVIKAKLKKDKN